MVQISNAVLPQSCSPVITAAWRIICSDDLGSLDISLASVPRGVSFHQVPVIARADLEGEGKKPVVSRYAHSTSN